MQINALTGWSNFPVALIVLAAIAVFLILRLRSILGRRVGFERPAMRTPPSARAGQVIEGRATPVQQDHAVPDPASPLGQRLMQIVNRDRNFDPPKFLENAETAFRMIVTAFAEGNRASLRPLLTEPVFQSFDAAITAREQAGETQQTEIKAITAATIEDAQIMGDLAAVIIRFQSEQTNVTTGGANAGTSSDTAAKMVDLWTFERGLKGKDTTWRLAAARND